MREMVSPVCQPISLRTGTPALQLRSSVLQENHLADSTRQARRQRRGQHLVDTRGFGRPDGLQPLRNLKQRLDAGAKAAHGRMVLLQLTVGKITNPQFRNAGEGRSLKLLRHLVAAIVRGHQKQRTFFCDGGPKARSSMRTIPE